MQHTEAFFDIIFRNARTNAILIMNADGFVESVNEAFSNSFGYTAGDLQGKHFRMLYTEKDKATRKPEIELNQTHRSGSSSDENYIVHKDGTPIWVTGEAILVQTEREAWVVKVIHNIHAQKQLERYLLSSTELLNSLFESVQQSGLLLLNSQMKVVRTNAAFRTLFQIDGEISEGARLQDLGADFWKKEELRTDVRNALVRGGSFKKAFLVDLGNNDTLRFEVTAKVIAGDGTEAQQLLLMIKPT